MAENIEKTSEDNAEELVSKTFKCPSCGNFLSYDPETQKLKCDHCNSVYPLAPVQPAMELVYSEGSELKYEDWGETKSIKCKSCGAVSILNKYQTAVNCPFCGAPNIVAIDDIAGLKPNVILPFSYSRAQVKAIFSKWMKSKLFAPSKFKKKTAKASTEGVYIPCFTFDASVSAIYTIRYGEHYTVTVGSGKNRRVETRTKWYVDNGSIGQDFDDIQVEASQHMTEEQLDKIGGFDTVNCVGYHNQFVAGYNAERYSKSLDESWGDAKEIIKEKVKAAIIDRYHADVIDYVKTECSYSDQTYKYALVPIWMVVYDYEKKKYGCVINGRNGRTVGKYPLSKLKISTATIVGVTALAGIIYLIMKYLF